MKKYLVKFLLSFSSFSGILLFLLICNRPDIPVLSFNFLNKFDYIPKYIVFILSVIFIAWGALKITEILPANETAQVKSIYPMESSFLPTYIGLFVISLGLNNNFMLENSILLILLFVFWLFLENVSYFNPFFLIFGYRFYEVITIDEKKITVISKKKDLKDIKSFNSLIRISNFNYIEK